MLASAFTSSTCTLIILTCHAGDLSYISYQRAQVNPPNTVWQIQEQYSWAKCGKGLAPYPSLNCGGTNWSLIGLVLTGVYRFAIDFHKKVKRSLYTSFELRGLAWDANKAVTFSKETSVMTSCHFKELIKLKLYCSLKLTQPFKMIVIILCISMLMILNNILVIVII